MAQMPVIKDYVVNEASQLIAKGIDTTEKTRAFLNVEMPNDIDQNDLPVLNTIKAFANTNPGLTSSQKTNYASKLITPDQKIVYLDKARMPQSEAVEMPTTTEAAIDTN